MSGTETHIMPDVTNSSSATYKSTLDWVGMSNIHLPTRLLDTEVGELAVSAFADTFVSLDDADAKGIHMSRLFLALEDVLENEAISLTSLSKITQRFLDTHEGLSEKAYVALNFDLSLKRPALKSDNSGWKAYPCRIVATRQNKDLVIELEVKIPYSSTCPCSAALARQLIQEQFENDFDASQSLDYNQIVNWLGSKEGIVATPHSQRSIADIKIQLNLTEQSELPFSHIINMVEGVLKTPVQTAVKREDEQAFAHLNGQNLMFCEDAARRIKSVLDIDSQLADFWVRVNHLESLHAHDAVAIVTKGVENGYQPVV